MFKAGGMSKPIQLDLVKNIPDLVSLGEIDDMEKDGGCTLLILALFWPLTFSPEFTQTYYLILARSIISG